MIDIDFEYDGIYLSDFNCAVCSISGSGDNETISEGSEITFNLTPVAMGDRHILTGARYESCITAEFDICKIPTCKNGKITDEYFFNYDEEREIMRWLNRKEMLPLMLVSEHYEGIYFNGSFNVQRIEQYGKIVGFSLSFFSDRPFGYIPEKNKFSVKENGTKILYDTSDEIGTTIINMDVTLKSGGTLTITNSFDGRMTQVKNCVDGETLSFTEDLLFSSSDETHMQTLMNDFNFIFPTLNNSYTTAVNKFTFSLPCDVVINYKSIRKVGV